MGGVPKLFGRTACRVMFLMTCHEYLYTFQATKSLQDLTEVQTLDLSPECKSKVSIGHTLLLLYFDNSYNFLSRFRKVHALIRKMSVSPVQVTAAKFFTINRAVLTSVRLT